MSKKNHFKKGEKVFYPQVGLGKIEDIIFKKIEGKKEKFYKIHIIKNNSKVFIPVKSSNVRKLIKEKMVKDILSFLETDEFSIEKDWKQRSKLHDELFSTGKAKDLALILKNLSWIEHIKGLTKSEKKFRQKVQKIFLNEISTVSGKSEEIVKEEIFDRIDKGIKAKEK